MARPSNNIPINSPEEGNNKEGNKDQNSSSQGFWDRLNGEDISKQIQEEFNKEDLNGQPGVNEYDSIPFEEDVQKATNKLEKQEQAVMSSKESRKLTTNNRQEKRGVNTAANPQDLQYDGYSEFPSDTMSDRNMGEEPLQPDQPGSTPERANALDTEQSSPESGEERQQLSREDIAEHLRTNLSDNPTKQEIDDVYRDVWKRGKAAGGIQFRKGENILIDEGAESEGVFEKVVKPQLDRVRKEVGKTPDTDLEKVIEPFSQFDLKEKLKSNTAAKDIWSEVEENGLYLSVKGPCYAEGKDGWKKYDSFKAYRDYISSSEGNFPEKSIDSSDVKKVLEEDIQTLKQRSQFSEDEEKALNQESAKDPVSSQEILSLLESNLSKNPSEDKREAVYKEIWEKVKERGEIETLDGGAYRREKVDTGISDYTWYRISPSGSRGQYGFPETRASRKEDGAVPFAYNKFFLNVISEYEQQLKEQQRAGLFTDTASDIPESVKENSESIPMKDPLDMDYAQDLSAEVRNELMEGRGLYRAYIHWYREYQSQKQAKREDLSEDLKQAFNLGEQDSLAYKLQDFSRSLIRKAQTTADIKAFLDIAPKETMTTVKKKARRALEDDEFRESFLKAEKQKVRLQERRRQVRKNGDSVEEKLREIDKLITGLKEKPSEFVAEAGERLNQLNKREVDQVDTEQDEMLDQNQIEIDDMVMLTEKGSPRWSEYHAVEDMMRNDNGELLIRTDKGSAYWPVEKFKLEPTQDDESDTAKQPANSFNGNETNAETKTAMTTKEEIREIIHNSDSPDQAVNSILQEDMLFWNKDQKAVREEQNWVIYSDTVDGKVDEFTHEEMKQQVREAIIAMNEKNKLKIDNFVDNVTNSVNKIVQALPEDESSDDEEDFKAEYQEFRNRIVADNDLLSHQEVKRFRDRFVQLMHYYKKERPELWRRSEVVYRRDVKEGVAGIDQVLENSPAS